MNFWRFCAQEKLSLINDLYNDICRRAANGISSERNFCVSAAIQQGLLCVLSQTQAIGYRAYKGSIRIKCKVQYVFLLKMFRIH